MVMDIRIDMKGLKELNNTMANLAKEFPREVRNGINDWGGSGTNGLEFRLKKRLRQVSQEWSGSDIYESIRWNPIKPAGNIGYITMSIYGVYLSRMRPHWVSLKPGRKITQWAEDRGINKSFTVPNRFGGRQAVRSIFVKPHEFIDSTIFMHLNRLESRIRFYVRRAIEKSRRR